MKYKVGDRVKIKSWKKMLKEYELDSEGDIIVSNTQNHPLFFVTTMRKYCKTVMTINKIYGRGTKYCMKEDERFYWTDEMIESKVTKKEEV